MEIIAQKRHDQCHVGCVLTVLNAFNRKINYNTTLKEINGNSLFDIREFLESNGIKSCSYLIDKSRISEIDFTIMIAHLKDLYSSHFVVLEKKNNAIYFYDPSKYFPHRINKYFIKRMSGYVLNIESPLFEFKRSLYLQIHYPSRLLISTVIITLILILVIS